ncbi:MULTISPECIES: tryptophan synthase subunit alpha [unclassified Mucilaginibacter]|uniref:tryptophan synthase subunit alpha n=1 Tax=unclassified Mucilaginibacter TaxID=2617802 RepID=UPI002AC999DB|nr:MULTISPECIES: tryptophan synthase subunit alpha [unclassified Mucilaginibacter]MEB0262468.1 tryptophan synthase subunit alpha [Mucilaginibacter sp. 10I4]MEB0279908.1 tryptophan synthase subunit alpha [Mucilaginibacter sp. 10B2]MEB0300054.1 tryptophan synthase subunit alpha [Mucilaginibacter sp. 5C4]WPX25718.1 tryptophan synthase subunit alpha [Mucilaginibacter sp. 5C4]
MNRLNQLFSTKKENLLSIYFTAGYPELNTTVDIAEALEKAGADFLEIGFPYSDPIADGPTIQHSSQTALDNGMTLNLLFEQLKDLRSRVSIPILLMGYVNPIVQYGVERFCKAAAGVGVDGIIVPDLPMYEYEMLYINHFEDNGLSNIFLVTPQTSEERIRKIDTLSNSFIYLLSSSSITGGSLQLTDNIEGYYSRIKAMELNNPTIIGFGISDKRSFSKACEYANGAIVGSAFVKLLGEDNYMEKIPAFIKGIKNL